MWLIKEKDNNQLLVMWPNFIPYSRLQERVVTALLLTSTPLWPKTERKTKLLAFIRTAKVNLKKI